MKKLIVLVLAIVLLSSCAFVLTHDGPSKPTLSQDWDGVYFIWFDGEDNLNDTIEKDKTEGWEIWPPVFR